MNDWSEAIEAERRRAQRKAADLRGNYRRGDDGTCENCGRVRVLESGVCEKCEWDNDAHDFASVTRPYWRGG